MKPILELNPDHAIVPKLSAVFAADHADPRLATYARLLLGQAQLAEGAELHDPDGFRTALMDLMVRAI